MSDYLGAEPKPEISRLASEADNDALINKLAMEMVSSKDLLKPVAAPSSLLGRYGLVTVKGIANVPGGIVNAAEDSIKNPVKTLEMIGSAAVMGAALKVILPEAGPSGKIAAGLIGAYFTYKAAEPVVNTYKFAARAKTMNDIDLAAKNLGNIGGEFIVHSGISALGYKLGSAGAEHVLLSERLDGFANAKQAFWDGVGDKTSKAAGRLVEALGVSSSPEPVLRAGSLSLEPHVPGTQRLAATDKLPPSGVLTGNADMAKPMDITVQLKSKASDLAMDRALKRIALGRQNPLSDLQFNEKFGASQESLLELTKFANENGLKVASADLSSGRVVLSGNTGDFSKAFQTKLSNYDLGGLSVRGRSGALAVPESLANHIEGIFGMDDRPQAHSYARFQAATQAASVAADKPGALADKSGTAAADKAGPDIKAGADIKANPDTKAGLDTKAGAEPTAPVAEPRKVSGYLPSEVAEAYEFPQGTTGKGQSVAIIQLGGGIDMANEAAYYKAHGKKMPEIKVIEINGAKAKTGTNPAADGEVALDSQVIGMVAPDAKQNIIFAPNSDRGFIDAVSRATFPEKGELPNNAISISWGAPMEMWTEQGKRGMNLAFKKAALKGISVFAAAGDDGAINASPSRTFQVDYPAADPYVTGVGGTRLVIKDGKILSEVAWNNGEGRGATGGGISPDPVPDYQKGLKLPDNANKTGIPGRGVPDISGNADAVTGYRIRVGGSEAVVGGTSATAPLYAALALRLNEGLGGERVVGFMNPFLYKHGMSGKANFFNDIIKGDNNGYSTSPSWDAVSGWGSLNGEKLLQAYKAEQSLSAKAISIIPQGLKSGKDIIPLPLNISSRDQALKTS